MTIIRHSNLTNVNYGRTCVIVFLLMRLEMVHELEVNTGLVPLFEELPQHGASSEVLPRIPAAFAEVLLRHFVIDLASHHCSDPRSLEKLGNLKI